MNKYIIPLAVLIILAVGGMAVSGELNPLIQGDNSTGDNSTINSTNDDNSSSNGTESSNSSNSNNSNTDMKEVVKDPQKVQEYLDSQGKTHDTVYVDGKRVDLTSSTKAKNDVTAHQDNPNLN